MVEERKKEWYKHWWGVIIAFLLLPFLVIWYAWARSKWTKNEKIGATVVAVVFIIAALAVAPQSDTQNNQQQNAPQSSNAVTQKTEAPTPPPPPPEPKVYQGSGDDVVTIQKPADGPAIIAFECSNCSGNTVLKTNGAESLLVNTIGSYSGSHLIDVRSGSYTTEATINATGVWKMTVSRLDKAMQSTGQALSGQGDSVLHITGRTTKAEISNTGDSNFVVDVYPENGGFSDLAVNTIGSYKGTVPLKTSAYIQITSNGTWSITPK